MTDKGWHRVKNRALLVSMVFVVLGLMSGLFAYESVKERGVSMKRDVQTAAAERMAAPPPIDAPRAAKIETATFALG